MDREIKVEVKDKVATAPPDAVIVCGNSDYTILFQFDEEWDGLEVKTARFKYSTYAGPKQHIDVPFTGNMVEVPILTNAHKVEVGVYAGNLTTTTGAHIRCLPSIRCGSGEKAEPSPDKYDALMELIKELMEAVGGVTNHADLEGRDAADQHPISAIKNLQAALDACRKASEAISAEEVGYDNPLLETTAGTVKAALDEAIGFVLSQMPDLVTKKHAHKGNLEVLDQFGEEEGKPTYKGEVIGGTGPALHLIEAPCDYASVIVHAFCENVMTIECALLPKNARVRRVEIPDVVNDTDEYLALEDMAAHDLAIKQNDPFLIAYPKNMQGDVFPVAAYVTFIKGDSSFYNAAVGYLYADKIIKIYYEMED